MGSVREWEGSPSSILLRRLTLSVNCHFYCHFSWLSLFPCWDEASKHVRLFKVNDSLCLIVCRVVFEVFWVARLGLGRCVLCFAPVCWAGTLLPVVPICWRLTVGKVRYGDLGSWPFSGWITSYYLVNELGYVDMPELDWLTQAFGYCCIDRWQP